MYTHSKNVGPSYTSDGTHSTELLAMVVCARGASAEAGAGTANVASSRCTSAFGSVVNIALVVVLVVLALKRLLINEVASKQEPEWQRETDVRRRTAPVFNTSTTFYF